MMVQILKSISEAIYQTQATILGTCTTSEKLLLVAFTLQRGRRKARMFHHTPHTKNISRKKFGSKRSVNADATQPRNGTLKSNATMALGYFVQPTPYARRTNPHTVSFPPTTSFRQNRQARIRMISICDMGVEGIFNTYKPFLISHFDKLSPVRKDSDTRSGEQSAPCNSVTPMMAYISTIYAHWSHSLRNQPSTPRRHLNEKH